MSARFGRITLLMGPMCAGKSSELKRLIHTHRIAKRTVVVVKHAIAVRNDDDRNGLLSSRDGTPSPPATYVEHLSEIDLTKVSRTVFAIDEAQFYLAEDLRDFCMQAARQDNIVIVAALSGDSNMQMWPSIVRLMPVCDDVKPFTAVCDFCGEDASFTVKIAGTAEVLDVNGVYKPACRKCHETYSK